VKDSKGSARRARAAEPRPPNAGFSAPHQGPVQPTQLDYSLAELTFRFNRRISRSRGLLFYRLLEQAVATQPVTYQRIAACKA